MHTCDAVIVFCIDFRFQKFLRDWTDQNLKDQKFDLVAQAGSTKDLEYALKQIEISVRLHNIKVAYLIHHEDCGAYGGDADKNLQDLKSAEKVVTEKFPQLQVTTLFAYLDGSFEKV